MTECSAMATLLVTAEVSSTAQHSVAQHSTCAHNKIQEDMQHDNLGIWVETYQPFARAWREVSYHVAQVHADCTSLARDLAMYGCSTTRSQPSIESCKRSMTDKRCAYTALCVCVALRSVWLPNYVTRLQYHMEPALVCDKAQQNRTCLPLGRSTLSVLRQHS